jgi:hypothetical protein
MIGEIGTGNHLKIIYHCAAQKACNMRNNRTVHCLDRAYGIVEKRDFAKV